MPPDKPLTLKVAGESYEIKPDAFEPADDGITSEATVEEIIVPDTGQFVMSLSLGDKTLERHTTQAITGWFSVLAGGACHHHCPGHPAGRAVPVPRHRPRIVDDPWAVTEWSLVRST